MAEFFNFSLGFIGGGGSGGGKIRKNYQEISLNEATRRILNLPISQKDKKKLFDVVKKAPHGSLNQILINYKNYIK